jgi:uncharacterized protein with von Willebrand factor type A (vWA) domain
MVLCVDVSWSTARSAGLFLSIAGAVLGRARDTRVLAFVDRFVDATPAVRRWLAAPLDPADGATSAGEPRGAGGSRAEGPRRPPQPGSAIVRGGVSFADVLGALPDLHLGAPSDYGRAFHGLLRSPARPSGRRTVLVVLGDGRSNRLDPQPWAFEEIAGGCGAALWLVPEPAGEWGTGDSALLEYLPAVDVAVEARDLDGLARGVAELVRVGGR